MTAYNGDLDALSGSSEAAAIADIAVQGIEPNPIEPGVLVTVPDGQGGVKVINTDEYAPTPRRAKATRSVLDAKSFVEYTNRHGLPGTEVFAHSPSSTVVAVIDSHVGAGQDAGWQGHRVTLNLEQTVPWKAWTKYDGAWFSQSEFAEFIEQRAVDVKTPSHADLLELAQHFEAKKSADFSSSERMDNGQVQFTFTEKVGAKAGQKGQLEIPKDILLVLKPYVGGVPYHVYANFRYRLSGGELRLGYVLVRPQDILDAAFADIVTEIREGRTEKFADKPDVVVHEGIEYPIFLGKP